MSEKKLSLGDMFGGFAAALVAMPSAIAYGLISYAPLGAGFSGKAAIAGILGTAVLGLLAALVGGSSRLISAPCAPAAAVLSVFTAGLVSSAVLPTEAIPLAITVTAFCAGALQLGLGLAGGGRLIKYIPYPVVAGYMTGVGSLILISQIPKMLAVPKGTDFLVALVSPLLWEPSSVLIGLVTMAAMVLAPKVIKVVPAAVIALAAGVLTYGVLAFFDPALRVLEGNHSVVGPVGASPSQVWDSLVLHWAPANIPLVLGQVAGFIVPVFTLAVLLSIDALKTCVILDVMSGERHDSNRVLLGQGFGNIAASLVGGMPGAGTMGASLVNINSGGKTQNSGIVMGVVSMVSLFALGGLIGWIPLSALSGVLIVIAFRMMDFKAFRLLRTKATVFDFLVIIAVVIAAITQGLIIAAGVGIGMAIVLFLREQIRFSVIHRRYSIAEVHSKKRRLGVETEVLEKEGTSIHIVELQGQLFFGTADQLYTELEPLLKSAKAVVLDLKRVLALDYTAANVLKQIRNRLREHGGTLILTQIPVRVSARQNIATYLAELDFVPDKKTLFFFDDLDEALEWTEDSVLEAHGLGNSDEAGLLELAGFEFFRPFTPEVQEQFARVLATSQYKAGDLVFSRGEMSNQIYFVRRGEIKIMLEIEGSEQKHHLATFGRGDFLGEMAFLDKSPRSAAALCTRDTDLFILERTKFKELLASHPDLGTQFYAQLAKTVAVRLRLNHAEIQALERTSS